MFRGRYEHTIDQKGRTSIPSRFRELLSSKYADDRLIVTSYLDPCLIAYPVAEWQAFEERLRHQLGTAAKIHRRGKKGRIEIPFYSDQELEGILEHLGLKTD